MLAVQTIPRGSAPFALCAGVEQIELSDFRNHAAFRLAPEARAIALVGPNGTGKTNLLEAISMLAPGGGLRRARLAELAREGEGRWSVSTILRAGGETLRVGTGWERNGRRRVRIDGVDANNRQLGDLVSVHWLVPTMDGIFNASPSARRNFLDRLIAGTDPSHVSLATAWGRHARERREILERGGEDSWLRPVERAMAEAAVRLAKSRMTGVERLSVSLARPTGRFPAADVEVRGEVEGLIAELGEEPATERLEEIFCNRRDTDLRVGRTTSGPNRSDFLVRHRAWGTDAARCSSGEQKALLVSLALAAARIETERRGEPPVVLLDEVFAHLDLQRRVALADELEGLGAQVWLTGTDAEPFEGFRELQRVSIRAVRVAASPGEEQ